MAKPQFSVRFLLLVTAVTAMIVAVGIKIMPAAYRQNVQLAWVGPVFVALVGLAAVLACVALARCGMVVYEALLAVRNFWRRWLGPPRC